ncbi:hypothetical protein [Tenacibaculum sp. SG-28]|uniref:hypothetical protein n=1 Tax=Tenacibaculum sp. SG-28 TaxID=754426 RepID=UPI000CF478CF|nr:hypothetical protein [Tenacibaculum sp. SG-28]PQJ22975.1 hypothetical protein BSU00_01485 [Tenacibaculum sp. SG-28]
MIVYTKRAQVNEQKYNHCIKNAVQSNIFGFSWYLDIVADSWDVLVLNDYEAVMPLPKREKYFFKYVYPPLWLVHLGIYSLNIEDENEFLIELLDDFSFVELRLNPENSFTVFSNVLQERKTQILYLNSSYSDIRAAYNRNRKRELKKAKGKDLTECWNDAPIKLLHLFKENIGNRLKKVRTKDYDNLLHLMQYCLERKVGEMLTVYDAKNKLVSGAFFLKYKDRVTELVCASDLENRNNGANTFMNDRAICKYQRNFSVFDFGGSSMQNIAKYYYSFGATDAVYMQIVYNNLPAFFKFLKR